jgi:hypothetical protein
MVDIPVPDIPGTYISVGIERLARKNIVHSREFGW